MPLLGENGKTICSNHLAVKSPFSYFLLKFAIFSAKTLKASLSFCYHKCFFIKKKNIFLSTFTVQIVCINQLYRSSPCLRLFNPHFPYNIFLTCTLFWHRQNFVLSRSIHLQFVQKDYFFGFVEPSISIRNFPNEINSQFCSANCFNLLCKSLINAPNTSFTRFNRKFDRGEAERRPHEFYQKRFFTIRKVGRHAKYKWLFTAKT